MTVYYVDGTGAYLGGFSENNPSIPAEAIAVANPPPSGDYKWSGSAWYAPQEYLTSELQNYRWQKEVEGVLYLGMTIPSDDRSKMLINGAYNKALQENDPAKTKKFKMPGTGFVDITNQNIIDMALAVADHVQKCFDTEAEITSQIEATIVTTTQEMINAFDNYFASL